MKHLFLAFVRLYQIFLRPLIGPCCRFWPSCSDYAIQALSSHPLHTAIYLIIRRIFRCSAFSPGGVDEVPPPKPPKT